MAQNAPASTITPGGANLVTPGGSFSKLNVSAAAVVKATPGRLCKIVIGGTVGTGGAYTFNDCATTGAAAAGNQIISIVGTQAVGTVIVLDWPCATGIVLSAFATGGSPVLSISFS